MAKQTNTDMLNNFNLMPVEYWASSAISVNFPIRDNNFAMLINHSDASWAGLW